MKNLKRVFMEDYAVIDGAMVNVAYFDRCSLLRIRGGKNFYIAKKMLCCKSFKSEISTLGYATVGTYGIKFNGCLG